MKQVQWTVLYNIAIYKRMLVSNSIFTTSLLFDIDIATTKESPKGSKLEKYGKASFKPAWKCIFLVGGMLN